MGVPAIVIAGTNSGCGKTTISMGIMAAFVDMGLKVQPYKVGPDYIDPMFHTFITGRESRNLDSWMLSRDTVEYLFAKNAGGADIAVVEGVMGLYDGYGGSSLEGSTADVSKIIGAPVILVINGEAMSLSAAALVSGFAGFDKDTKVQGVIINNISGYEHYRLLRDAIESHTGVAVMGYLKRSEDFAIGSRHLGLVTSSEINDLKEKAAMLSRQIRETVDLDLLLKLAREADGCRAGSSYSDGCRAGSSYSDGYVIPDCNITVSNSCEKVEIVENCPLMKLEEVENCPLSKIEKVEKRPLLKIRLAVARDKAFCFYYRDNLDLLEDLGAELVFFSPLEEAALPGDIDGLYMGGGYPEIWAGELQKNHDMRRDIKSKIDKGLPAYAECGGFMYMTDSIVTNEGSEYEMVGAIPGKSTITPSLKRFGYVFIKTTEDSILAPKGAEIRAHEFHYSETATGGNTKASFEISKRKDNEIVKAWSCGFKVNNILAGYPHLHFWANQDFARGFVESCGAYKQKKRCYEA